MWDVKEPTNYSKRVGREVPSVLTVLLSCKMWLVAQATYAKTATLSQKGTLPSAR